MKATPITSNKPRQSSSRSVGCATSRSKSAGPTEAMLARVESARLEQRQGGHFDCFGRAMSGFCDQGECMYHDECLAISGRMA